MPVKVSGQFTLYDKPEGYLGLVSEGFGLRSETGYVIVVAQGLVEKLLGFCGNVPGHTLMPPEPFSAIVFQMIADLFTHYVQAHPEVPGDEINKAIQILATAVAGLKVEEEVKDGQENPRRTNRQRAGDTAPVDDPPAV